MTNIPTYRAGTLAYYETVSGMLLPCKVISVKPDDYSVRVEIKLTANRNNWKRGEVFIRNPRWVIPRSHVKRGHILPYKWEPDDA